MIDLVTTEEMHDITNARLEWAKALRSGFYRQAKGQLIKDNGNGTYGFCCIGVATLHFAGMDALQRHVHENSGYDGGFNCQMPKEVENKLGLTFDSRSQLATYNDRDGVTFDFIATLIERNADKQPSDFLHGIVTTATTLHPDSL